MKPALKDNWATVYSVDALTGLQEMPEKSVHCAVTSPPYWNLRSYLPSGHPDKAMELGAEPTPELYVERLVEVFRELRRVLRDDGTCWINLGDGFYSSQSGQNGTTGTLDGGIPCGGSGTTTGRIRLPKHPELKQKDLIGLPWMVAFALRADGWYLRSDIIWSKPSPMPESITDRPTNSHEYMFLLTKSPRYFFDQEAVRENNSLNSHGGLEPNQHKQWAINGASQKTTLGTDHAGRNIRSVWNIATRPYPGSHYAVFPPDLVYPCIKAGTSERGGCEACGAPWERVVERDGPLRGGTRNVGGRSDGFTTPKGGQKERDAHVPARTVGWQPTCSCNGEYIKEPYEVTRTNRETGELETFTRYRSVYVPGIPLSEHPVIPATVLDPFVGSGTTLLAARKFGRRSIGFDLDYRNIAQIKKRFGPQGVLL